MRRVSPSSAGPPASRLSLTALVVALVLAAAAVPAAQEPRARELSRALTLVPRLAGTRGSQRATGFVAARLAASGLEVTREEYDVLLSYPRRLEFALQREGGATVFHRIETFDPDAVPTGDVPRYNAWSASGRVESGVVDVGSGLRADYERLAAAGIEVAGRIALCRYGGAYRGVKAELAQEHGCVGLLLFDDPVRDGAERGPTWPDGPFKPGWEAQRGSISALARVPGDPSTPGWPSPTAGDHATWPPPAAGDGVTRARLGAEEVAGRLPAILCLPIGADEAASILALGTAARVLLDLDVPRVARRIVDVIGRLPGAEEDWVLAGNHRDAWVRGAQDAGSGTVTLLLVAEELGRRAGSGWTPRNGIALAFWDAEEFGLIGSTEWGEAHAGFLGRHLLSYVNADATVSGLAFRVSGSPGLRGPLGAALARVPSPEDPDRTLYEVWSADRDPGAPLQLPGSGSDYTVFLHHLGIPVLDYSFGGNPGGQYHTTFDDFAHMDRFLDPTWAGHEASGRFLVELLVELAERGRDGFDPAAAAHALARVAVESGAEEWLGADRGQRLAEEFSSLAEAFEDAAHPNAISFYGALAAAEGLAGRPWYKNRLWAPGLESGYAAETFPELRAAARAGAAALDEELEALRAAIERVTASVRAAGSDGAR